MRSSVVVVHPRVPAKNLKELAGLAKAKPGELTYASSATPGQLAGELFKIVANVKMLHVPYKGGGPAVIDLVGGHVDLMFSSVPTAVPMVKAGKLRAIAVAGLSRVPALPGVMTSKESGFPDLDVTGWYGLSVPASTPKDVVAKLNRDLINALKTPVVIDRFVAGGLEPKASSPEQMTTVIKTDLARWGRVVKTAGLKAQ